jgi:alkanesulfonate monooxygenase SsuD/methylene tetrahydromethanopterin reductase-like flavin-dependent oxidoreductase (luciferase family)
VRFGLVLDPAAAAGLATQARIAESAGFDLVWLHEDPARGVPNVFLAGASLASDTRGLRVGLQAKVGMLHPVYVAEDAAVCDLALEGRSILAIEAADGCGADLAEAVRILLSAHRPRPFRSEGPRWPTPADLEANAFSHDERVRVTPAPAQPELPTWIHGDVDVASEFGLPIVAETLDAGTIAWRRLDDDLGARALRLSRPAFVDVPVRDDDHVDHHRLVEDLQVAQRSWGLDTALLRVPAGLDGRTWEELVRDVQRLVRPRVQLDRLPPGLTEMWDDTLVRG